MSSCNKVKRVHVWLAILYGDAGEEGELEQWVARKRFFLTLGAHETLTSMRLKKLTKSLAPYAPPIVLAKYVIQGVDKALKVSKLGSARYHPLGIKFHFFKYWTSGFDKFIDVYNLHIIVRNKCWNYYKNVVQ